MIRYSVILLGLLFAAQAVNAQQPIMQMVEKARDPRIRIIDYNADQIFPITGHTGYQMTIEFEPDEKIETVGIGDSSGWQVTPNGNATLLFVKPTMLAPTTNMAVVTNKRRYNLELSARSGAKVDKSAITHVLRFRLPAAPLISTTLDEKFVSLVSEAQWNRNYRFEGSKTLVPEEIFDDGNFTFIRFAESLETPAIFAVSGAEDENLVNSNMRGKFIMVDRVSAQIVLRHGKLVTRLYNEAFASPEPGPNAPKPRSSKKRGSSSR